MNLDDHESNFKYIIESLESYIKDNCQEEKLTYFANLSDSFDISQILEGNEKALIHIIFKLNQRKAFKQHKFIRN